VVRILEVRQTAAPIMSPIRNAYIDFSKMTAAVVAIVTDIVRDGKRVVLRAGASSRSSEVVRSLACRPLGRDGRSGSTARVGESVAASRRLGPWHRASLRAHLRQWRDCALPRSADEFTPLDSHDAAERLPEADAP
jgi:hypothetical protein